MGAFDHLKWTYDGAFEQLFGLGRREFEQKFSKNSNARGLPGGGGGVLKLRFDWYIIGNLRAGDFASTRLGACLFSGDVKKLTSAPKSSC